MPTVIGFPLRYSRAESLMRCCKRLPPFPVHSQAPGQVRSSSSTSHIWKMASQKKRDRKPGMVIGIGSWGGLRSHIFQERLPVHTPRPNSSPPPPFSPFTAPEVVHRRCPSLLRTSRHLNLVFCLQASIIVSARYWGSSSPAVRQDSIACWLHRVIHHAQRKGPIPVPTYQKPGRLLLAWPIPHPLCLMHCRDPSSVDED